MSKKQHDTPMLDQLESGPWPSFVTGLKRLAKDNDYMTDLMGQLEHSYKTRKGYWKGGTVGVFGYGGGVIPRFSEVAEMFPASKEFHTLRVQPPAGMHYNTDVLRKMCDIWEKHGSGLIAFHGQSGDIMFQGASTANVQGAFDELNELGFDLGGAGPAVRTSMSCVGAARCEQSCFDEARAHRQVVNTFPGRHAPSGTALQVQVQVLGLPERLYELDPARRHGRDRHLARQHPHRRKTGAQVVCQAWHDRTGQ
jgi:sulfite reductase alpha subunit